MCVPEARLEVYPVTAAEIEVNLWSYESETKKVIDTARELDIAVFAYSYAFFSSFFN